MPKGRTHAQPRRAGSLARPTDAGAPNTAGVGDARPDRYAGAIGHTAASDANTTARANPTARAADAAAGCRADPSTGRADTASGRSNTGRGSARGRARTSDGATRRGQSDTVRWSGGQCRRPGQHTF